MLFVKTGSEEKLVRNLKSRLDSSLFSPFAPTKEKLFRKNGKTLKEMKLCFPGYIFIDSELNSDDFIIKISTSIKMIDEVYRIVDYGDRRNIAMREDEKIFIKNLYGINYCIEGSVGLIEGDRIRITEGPLMGIENIIKKINRHKREAIIEIEFMGSPRQITVGLEIVERI